MSKLIERISKILSQGIDKRYVKERGEEIATSFLIRRNLKTGAYLAEELEFQSQDEDMQFRADEDHTVTLGTVLDRVFDIRKRHILGLYVIYGQRDCQVGKEITRPDDIWNFDLCKAMKDENHIGMFYSHVAPCVSFARDGVTEETVIIHLKENGGDEHTKFIRASIMRICSTDESDVSFSTDRNLPETYSILFAYDDGSSLERGAGLKGTVEKIVDKYAKGKDLDDDETALIAKISPEAGWHYSWGHKAFNEKRYWDALLYFEEVFYLLKERWFKDNLSDEGLQIFYHCCYLIGYCYAEMKLYEKAYFYLDFVWPLNNVVYCAEYINCLVNNKDIRAMNAIDGELERLDAVKDDDFTQEMVNYYHFLLRRRAYVLIDMNRLDEAEELFKKLLEADNRTEYIQNELDYIKHLREEQDERS